MQSPQPLTNICGFSRQRNFSHFLLKIYLHLLQKYPQHVTETWISVIWLIHPACSMMINTQAMTSNNKYNHWHSHEEGDLGVTTPPLSLT